MAAVSRLTFLALSLAAVLIALGCGGGDDGEGGDEGYPDEAVSNFMETCPPSTVESAQGALTPEEARTWCRCVINELEETLSFEGFREYDARVREQGPEVDPPSEVTEAAEKCM